MNGSIAIAATSAHAAATPDCVVLQHDPPQLNALDELSKLSGPDGLPRVAAVVVAKRAEPGFRQAALRAGAMELLVGDRVDPAALSTAIDDAVARFSVLERVSRSISADIEARQATERALRLANERHRAALTASEIGLWHWDPQRDGVLGDQNLLRLFGIEAQGGATPIAPYLERIHPDDRPRVEAAIARTLQTGGPYDEVFRVALPDGAVRWVHARGLVELGEDGRPVSFPGIVLDITRSHEATERLRASEATLRESEERFRALADNIAQLAWMADETGANTWSNRRWLDFTGTTPEEMKGDGWKKVQHPDHLARVVEKYRRHIESGEPWEDTFPLRGADGSYRWFLSRAIPIRDERGRVVRWFGTNTDITERREAEEALREADRRKDEFIAILAHELRNPLAPVRNAVQILQRLGPADPRLQRAREVIDRQVGHMARLIDDLLDVSRIARGKLTLQLETCDLAAIVRQTAEDYRAGMEAAGLSLVLPRPSGPVWVEGDPVRLAQMVGNLLHNATRFTDAGGRVDVRVEHDVAGRIAVVSVRDTGVGLDPALLSRLFDPFCQADQDLARSKGGLGLGLALTKGLAELHGGGVTAHSEGPGKGSTFSLRIPLSKARYERAPQDDADADQRDGLRILVVEDNRDAAETLGELLELSGHEVRLAFDGAAGVEAAREFCPDVVISDIGLPGALDGYAVARAIRADPALVDTYLIALSGYASEEARRRSREAGFDAHFGKPADIARLERLLEEVGRG